MTKIGNYEFTPKMSPDDFREKNESFKNREDEDLIPIMEACYHERVTTSF